MDYSAFPNVIVKDVEGKGQGVFAAKDFTKGEVIFDYDLLKNAKQIVTLEEAKELNEYESNHLASIGNDKFVVDLTPVGIVNHSCEPNVYEEFEVLTKGKLIAIRDINKGEELNKDYAHAAPDQIDNAMWEMDCNCNSPSCRETIHGDFFKMPKEWQKNNVQYLPTYLKQKYGERIKDL